jgi:NADPH:quinone reductase-like Zn-dependent oxidoreductase
MHAVVTTQYGSPDVLELREVDQPTPNANEVLVRVHAASVNAGDWHLLRGEPFLVRLMFGLRAPKFQILGSDVAGVVETVGTDVTQFRPGDAVFGDISAHGFGAFAEYVAVPETALAHKPEGLSFAEAAALPVAAGTALQALRDHGHIQAGQQVVINGASGGVGTYAVQIAKAFGAVVTGVCSTSKMEQVRALGADHVIDYTQEDFTKNGQQYDLIIAVNGYHPILHYRRALRAGGRYVMIGGANAQMFEALLLGPLLSLPGSTKLGNMLAEPDQARLLALKELAEAGKIAPVIDRCYPLAEVPEAIRSVEAGSARGKVVITVAS